MMRAESNHDPSRGEPDRPTSPERPARKRPGRWRRWLVRPLFWIFTLLIVLVALAVWLIERPGIQDRIVSRFLPELEQRLGRDIEVESVRWRLLPLSLEVRGVRIAGPSPGDLPLATAERIRLEADWAKVGRDRLRVESVEGEGIVFYLERYEGGGDNLPRWRRDRREDPFELELGTIRVRDSRFVYDDREVPLSLTARHVRADLVGIGGRQVQGDVVVEEVDFDLPTAEPYRAAVSGRVVLKSDGLRIQGGRVGSPEAALQVRGEVSWGEHDNVRLELEGPVQSDLFRRLGYVEDQIEGDLGIDGTFAWNDGVWGFRGHVSSPSLRLVDWRLLDFEAAVTGDRNAVWLDLQAARYGSGSVTGRVEVELSEETIDTEVRLHLDGVDLESFLADADVPVEGVAARLTGELDYRFSGGEWEQGSGWGVFDVIARVRRGEALPLDGTIPLTVEGGRLAVRAARLTAPSQVLEAAADYELRSRRGEIRFELESRDVGPLRELIAAAEEDPLWLPTEGRGRIRGRLELRPEGTRAPLQIDLWDARAPGLSADRVRGVLTVSSDAVRGLYLELARGTSAAIVAAELPFEGRGLSATIDLASWPVEEAGPWLPFELPLTGELTGGITLRQPEEDLEGTVGGFVELAELAGVPIDRIEADLTWDARRLEARSISLITPAGTIRARGDLGLDQLALDFVVEAHGLALSEAPIASYLGGGDLVGSLDLSAEIGGTAESPAVDARLTATEVSLDGERLGEVGDATILDLRWRDERVEVGGSVLGLARIEGGGRWDAESVDLDVELGIPDVRRLLALALDTVPEMEGGAEGSLRVTGEPRNPDLAIRLDELSLLVEGRPLRNLEPILVELHPEELRIRSLYLGTPSGASELFVAGTVGLGESRPLDLNLQATMMNRWISPWLAGVRLGGTTDVLGAIEGTVSDPRFNGQAEIRDGDLMVEALPFRIEELRAVILAYPDSVVLDLARGELGGGTVRASGRLDWPEGDALLDARIQTSFEDVTLRYPEGWLLRGDGELVWSLEEEGRQLVRGLVELDRAYYLRDVEVGLIQLLQRFFRHERQEVGVTDETLAGVDLNVLVRAPGTIRVRNNLADLSGRADLTVRGTLARPILFGRAEAEAGGTLVYGDNRYVVERGVLQFANPYRMEPILDLEAITRVADYDVTLRLFGSLDRLAVNFSSNPPLPDLEVLSLLVSGSPGRFSSGLTDLDPQQSSASAAEGLLFGQASSLISQRVGSLFGFDAFRIEPLSASGGQVSSARVTVGKRLSSRLYVTYSYDPSSTEEQRIQLEYRLGEGWLVRLTQEGEDYTLDVLRERRF